MKKLAFPRVGGGVRGWLREDTIHSLSGAQLVTCRVGEKCAVLLIPYVGATPRVLQGAPSCGHQSAI